jgi:hypothetical protein
VGFEEGALLGCAECLGARAGVGAGVGGLLGGGVGIAEGDTVGCLVSLRVGGAVGRMPISEVGFDVGVFVVGSSL